MINCVIYIYPNNKKEKEYMNQVEQYFISSKQLKKLEKQALEGDLEASWRVWEYYAFSALDYDNISIWEKILCENECLHNSYGTYNYASMLLTQKTEEAKRGWYWIYRCRKAGFVLDEYVDTLYEELDSQVQSNSPEISMDMFIKMTQPELKRVAYFGNGEAAFYLYNEKLKTQDDKDTSSLLDPHYDSPVYWLRIGAQNGSEKCKKQYIHLLKNSSNKYDAIRATFWEKCR